MTMEARRVAGSVYYMTYGAVSVDIYMYLTEVLCSCHFWEIGEIASAWPPHKEWRCGFGVI